ncbi:electron transport complex subunit E [Oscillospiraceae bacterium OttesenSCG-928-F05]|nr:electron transport complex subunit E [Oscillospiraceae bacterium OttesenSCG-928-F05]
MRETFNQIRNGVWYENPTLVLLLGMCPTLAVSTSVINALGMGASATLVLICSNTVISLLRKVIPQKVRIAAYIVIIAGFVTMVDLLLQAFLPSISESLGIFIPLIVVNCIILARAEAFASKNGPLRSAVDGLSMGLGFTFALTVVATIREIVGNGTFFGIDLFGGHYPPALLIVMPVGGFLTLGFVIAAMQKIMNRQKKSQ